MAGLPQRLHKIDVQIGFRLKELRKQSGVTQLELGEMLGVAFQQIQRYEKGKNRLASSTLWKISQKLGVPITWFFDDLEE